MYFKNYVKQVEPSNMNLIQNYPSKVFIASNKCQSIQELFEQALKNVPCLIFVDEVESLARQRGKDDNQTRDNICDQFLTELDKVKRAQENIYFMCASNHPGLLCSAFLSRMQMKIEFPCPNFEARQKMLLSKASLPDSEPKELVDLCDGFSVCDIQDHIFENG